MSLPKQETKTYLHKKMDLRDIFLLCASLLVAAPSICQGACSINPYCSDCVNYTEEGQTKWRFYCDLYNESSIDSSHFMATIDTVDLFQINYWGSINITINNGAFGNIPNILRMNIETSVGFWISISPMAFSHSVQNNMRSLILWNARLTTVPSALRYLTALQELDLGNNRITGDPANYLSHLTSLRSLCLDKNSLLSSIPASLQNLANLRKLSLASCSLNQTSVASFDQLPRSLGWLSVNGNPLYAVPPGIGLLENLTYLDISGCNLNSLPANVFVNQNKLEVLDLSGNPKIVPTLDVLVHRKSLKILKLNSMSLTDIPVVISGMANLVELDLSLNGILEINQNHFAKMTQLKKLKLYRNKIASLDLQAFQNCDQLEELELNYNLIHQLTLINFVPQNLRYLNLRENRFETLDKCTVSHLLSQVHISFRSDIFSPYFICDCRMAWVRKLREVFGSKMTLVGSCNRPRDLSYQTLYSYTLSDCTREDESFENCNNISTTPLNTKLEQPSEALNSSFVNSAQLSSLQKDISNLQTITTVSVFVAVVAIVASVSGGILLQIYYFRERNRVPSYGWSQGHVNQGLQLSEEAQNERSLERQSSGDIQYQNTDDTASSGPGSDCVNAPPRYTGWV